MTEVKDKSNPSTNWLKWVLVGVLVLGLSLMLGQALGWFSIMKLTYERVKRGEITYVDQQGQDPKLLEIGLAETEFQLIEGWNFVSFPLRPASFDSAADLMIDVAKKGGYVTVVSVWDGDGWKEYAQREKERYGQNFAIEPGKAYFLKSHKQMDWKVVGDEVQDVTEYQLKEGWNTLGMVTEGMKAVEVLDGINRGQENATVIDWWTQASQWELFIKRFLPEGVREYGENFPILTNRGYMVLLNKGAVWRLDE